MRDRQKRAACLAALTAVINRSDLPLTPATQAHLQATAQQLANGGKVSALVADSFPYLLREKAYLANDPDFDALFTLVQTQAATGGGACSTRCLIRIKVNFKLSPRQLLARVFTLGAHKLPLAHQTRPLSPITLFSTLGPSIIRMKGGMRMQVKIEIDPAATDPVVTIRTATLTPALNQLVTQLQSQTPTLTFFQGDTEYYLDLNEILFFEVSDRRTWAHTATGLYQVKWRLKDLEARLPHHFLRCAKGVILNLHQIYSLTRNLTGCEIHFAHTDKRVFVSRHYYQALRDALAERMN